MIDRRKGTLVKKQFKSDLEYWIFRFATVNEIENLILQTLYTNKRLNPATLARYQNGAQTEIERLEIQRELMARLLSKESLTLVKKGFSPLVVSFEKVDGALVMSAEQIKHVMFFKNYRTPEQFFRCWEDYQVYQQEK